MTTLSASISNLLPSRLFLIRWACFLAGCTLKAWKAKPRKEKGYCGGPATGGIGSIPGIGIIATVGNRK